MARKERKLAVLTVPEEKAWEHAFAFHVDAGRTDTKAANLAWKDLQAEFPRLKAFDGCEATEGR
jgi:hypothetical protein